MLPLFSSKGRSPLNPLNPGRLRRPFIFRAPQSDATPLSGKAAVQLKNPQVRILTPPCFPSESSKKAPSEESAFD